VWSDPRSQTLGSSCNVKDQLFISKKKHYKSTIRRIWCCFSTTRTNHPCNTMNYMDIIEATILGLCVCFSQRMICCLRRRQLDELNHVHLQVMPWSFTTHSHHTYGSWHLVVQTKEKQKGKEKSHNPKFGYC